MAEEFKHATVLYRPGEARTFQAGEAVPAKGEGWKDEPFPADVADSQTAGQSVTGDPNTPSLAEVLAEKDAEITSLHDVLAFEREGRATAEAERDGLRIERDALKAQVAKFDPDGDGKAGGSKPKSG